MQFAEKEQAGMLKSLLLANTQQMFALSTLQVPLFFDATVLRYHCFLMAKVLLIVSSSLGC